MLCLCAATFCLRHNETIKGCAVLVTEAASKRLSREKTKHKQILAIVRKKRKSDLDFFGQFECLLFALEWNFWHGIHGASTSLFLVAAFHMLKLYFILIRSNILLVNFFYYILNVGCKTK